MAFDSLLRHFRRPKPEELEALREYHAQTAPLIERVRSMHDEWYTKSEVAAEKVRLANIASVNRWEVVRMGEQVEGLAAPPLAGGSHRDIVSALKDAARAYQLLATGHRYHRSEALCDGQTLLSESIETLSSARRQIETVLGTGD